MKKLLLSLLFGFLLLNLSCNRNDSTNSASIVGSWYMYSVTLSGTAIVSGNSVPVNGTQVANACAQKTTLTFNQNGTGNVVSWDDSSGTCAQSQNDNFTYSYNESTKKLSITIGTTTDVTTLKTLTTTDMVGEETVANQDIGGYIFTGTISSTFKKK